MKAMEIIDLSHTLTSNMPVFPGDSQPGISKLLSHENDEVQVLKLELTSHTGTHVDCPLHFFSRGHAADNLPVGRFYGRGVLLDCSMFTKNEEITLEHLKSYESEIHEDDFVLIYTDWYRYWGTEKYFDHFPVLSGAAVGFLLEKKVKGIGLDVISLDAIDSVDYPRHYSVLGKGALIVENLNKLHLLLNRSFHFAAFPLKIENGDGSPVRAVAFAE